MTDDERRRRAAEQEQRALRALESIMQGGDLSKETLDLSNEFSDGMMDRFLGRFRRRRGHGVGSSEPVADADGSGQPDGTARPDDSGSRSGS